MNALRRTVYMTCIALGAAAILIPNFLHVRQTHRVRQTLETLHTALQDFHVKYEVYVDESPTSGARLAETLIVEGYLKVPPLNPYTGKPYAFDGKERDRIEYRTSETLKTYSIKALHFEKDEVLMALESRE